MRGTLERSTFVRHPETGLPVRLEAGTKVPSWAEKLVTNPKLFQPVPRSKGAPKPVTDEEAAVAKYGEGPFRERDRKQLLLLATDSGVDPESFGVSSTKEELASALEAAGVSDGEE